MQIEDLYTILDLENSDSEIVTMSMTVKDSSSGNLTTYFVNVHGGLDSYNIE